MKKYVYSFLILIALILSSCAEPFAPVFYNINQDVPPLSATVSGTIRAVTRYTVGGKEFLVVVSDSGLRYKLADNTEHDSWKTYEALPEEYISHHYDYYGTSDHVGQQLLTTHSDSDTLFVVSVDYKDYDEEGTAIPSSIYIYAKKINLAEDGVTWDAGGEWKSILADGSGTNYTPLYMDSSYCLSAFAIFSTNAIQKAHRKVYLRTGYTGCSDSAYSTPVYYELSGLNAPKSITVTIEDTLEDASKNNANSAAYFNGEVKFFNSNAVATNENATKDATMIYYGGILNKKEKLFYKSTSDKAYTASEFDVGQVVSTICVCNDSLIIGRADFQSSASASKGGVVRAALNESGVPAADLSSFNTNIDTQLQASYYILSMLNVDPTQNETSSILYASIDFIGTGASSAVKYKDVGLWSYYPSRGNWNRE